MTGENKEKISKAAPVLPLAREVGQPGFITSSTFVKDRKDKELCIPKRWDTYEEMSDDACIAESLTATQTLMFLALYKGKWVGSKANTQRSQTAADYLNHQMHNMQGMSWAEACQNFVVHVRDGLSLHEIVAKKAKVGPYAGAAELVKLAPRTSKSIYAWVWDKKIRELKQVVQNPLEVVSNVVPASRKGSYLGNITDVQQVYNQGTFSGNEYPILSVNKLMHFRYNPQEGKPEGNSPMNAAFSAWQEKKVIDQYQIIGITRDFGGLPVFRAPHELYERASNPEEFPADAQALANFQDQMANLHAGREAYLFLTSDVHEGTNTQEYGIELLGVSGGGKQFDISEIIKSKNSEIYSAFSASYLNLGKDGNTSSYNLSTTGFNIHAFVLEKEIINCISTIEKLGKTLLAASGADLAFRDMPRFQAADPDQLSLEDLGKFVQRMGSVNKLTPEMLTRAAQLAGLPLDGIEDLDFSDKGDTKAGTGMGTSGQGTANQANSDTNMDNKSLKQEPRNLVADDYGDGKVALVDIDSGEVVQTVDKA